MLQMQRDIRAIWKIGKKISMNFVPSFSANRESEETVEILIWAALNCSNLRCMIQRPRETESQERPKLSIALIYLIKQHFGWYARLLSIAAVWRAKHIVNIENAFLSKINHSTTLTLCWPSKLLAFLTRFLHASKSSLRKSFGVSDNISFALTWRWLTNEDEMAILLPLSFQYRHLLANSLHLSVQELSQRLYVTVGSGPYKISLDLPQLLLTLADFY